MSASLVVVVLLLLATCAVAFQLPGLEGRARKAEALSIGVALLAAWVLDRHAFAGAGLERIANLLLLGYVFVRSTRGETRLLPSAALAVSAIAGYHGLLHTPVSGLLALACSFTPSRALHALLIAVFLIQVPVVAFP
jgi:hypothetical protein